MDPFCLVSTFQAAGSVMMWRMFDWHNLGPFVPTEHHFNSIASLRIVADPVHPILTSPCSSSDGHFQHCNVPCRKVHIISDWCPEPDTEFTVLRWPPQSPSQSNRGTLVSGGTGDFPPWRFCSQICSSCATLVWKCGPKSHWNDSSTLMNIYGKW